MSTSDTAKRTVGGAAMKAEEITSGGAPAQRSGLGCPRHRRPGRRVLPVGAWLGVGALTVGVGAVLAGGPAVAVACADTTHPAASSSATGAAGTSAAGGSTSRTSATTRSAPAARTPAAAAAASVSRGIPGAAATPGAGVTPGAAAAVSRAHLPASGAAAAVTPTAAAPAAALADIGASLRSLLSAGPVLVHPSLLPAASSVAPVVVRSAASTPAAATSAAAAVVTTTVVSPTATAPVTPLQKVLNAVTTALLSLGGLNPTTPTPAPGNQIQLALYAVALRLQNTFNPGGIPKAVGTITVGTPDPTTGALTFNPKIYTTTTGAPLTYQISVDPTQGKVTVNSDGVYTFTPTTAERRAFVGPTEAPSNSTSSSTTASERQPSHQRPVNPAILNLAHRYPGGRYVATQSPLGEASAPTATTWYVGGATTERAEQCARMSLIDTNTDLVSATLAVGPDANRGRRSVLMDPPPTPPTTTTAAQSR